MHLQVPGEAKECAVRRPPAGLSEGPVLGPWEMRLEGQAGQQGPVGQADELEAPPTGSRTTEGFPTGKRQDQMCVEGGCLERADHTVGGHGG